MANATVPLELSKVLDNLGVGVLIFDAQGKLLLDNAPARQILDRQHMVMIRTQGWTALAMLIDAVPGEHSGAADLRNKAQRQGEPVRFRILLAGSYTPCWMASIKDENGQNCIQVVLDVPDWAALTQLMNTFRAEARSAINNTSGHAKFVQNLLTNPPSSITTVQKLGERAVGMVSLVRTEMHHLQLLLDLLHRLELIRTGQIGGIIEKTQRKIDFADFLEDFLEELHEEALIDPAIDPNEYRDRLILDVSEGLQVIAPKNFLRDILRDILRNAFMYSETHTKVTLKTAPDSQGRNIEIIISDQGCGIRDKEKSRVFEPFQRARQPQVIREFGYGISLHLVKAEVEAMGGRIWFESQEGVGTTFGFKLPMYAE